MLCDDLKWLSICTNANNTFRVLCHQDNARILALSLIMLDDVSLKEKRA